MKKMLSVALFSIATLASGIAIAQTLPERNNVIIPGIGHATLVQDGMDPQGGIYRITHSNGQYLGASSGNEGEKVGWGSTQTKWVLHKNSTGWSIMSNENKANAVSKVDGGLALQRNQGAANQVWKFN